MPALSLKKLIIFCVLVTFTGIAILLTLLLPDEVGITEIIIIAFILLSWPLGFFASYFLKNRGKKSVAAGAELSAPTGKSSLSASRQYEELTRSAEEAVQFLRSSNLGNREVSDAVYGLPWYVLAGPPGSGKTSLALAAGLNFNALSSQRRADQNLVRATRDCEWRVTDQGVIVDTAGRYLTEGQDQDEWLGVIDTLKKYRRNRALDGFVLTVNAANILNGNESEIEQQAQVLRARLDEVIKSSGVRFPVYLVFTHCDSIPGFSDFFAGLQASERSQVWGATIPLEQANTAHALFDVEFDYLLDALMKRRLLKLGEAVTPTQQHGVFNFPLRMSETRRKLGLFTLALFRPNPFSELPLLRGFYFTSNPVADDARMNQTGLFTEDLFKQVIFRDKDIASSFQSQKAAPNQMAQIKLAVGVLAAVCLLWLGGSVVSYFNNSGLLNDAQENAKRVLDHYDAGRGNKDVKTSDAELSDLGKLRGTLQSIDELDNSWIGSLTHRFGLYSGGKVREQARQVYFDFVSQRFLAPALTKLEGELDASNPTKEEDLDDYYYKLQALKMLESQERVDPKFLEEKLNSYWNETASVDNGKKENLVFYAAQAALHDDDDKTVPRPLAETARVNAARVKLKNYSATKRVYNDILRRINKLGDAVDLAHVLGGQSGAELLEESTPSPVPYAFTKRAYFKHVTGDAMAKVQSDLGGKDDWVMGEKSAAAGVNIDELRARYSADYAAAWEKFLRSISVRKFTDKKSAVDSLGILAQENSPLKRIVEYVASETNLADPPKDSGALAWLKGILASKVGITDQKIGTAFAPLNRFSSESIAKYLAKLGEVRDKLRASPGTNWNEVAAGLKDNKDFEKAVSDTRDLLKPLDPSPGSKAAEELLAKPLDIIGAGQKGGDAKNIEDAWRNLVASAKKLESRYPFSVSPTDVQIPDLVAFYNPVDGELTNTFKKFLSNLVEGTPPGQLKTKAPAEFSEAAAAYLNLAFKLQSALFPSGSQQPKLNYSLAVRAAPNKKIEVSADGAKVTADGSAATANLSWPSSGETGIKVIVSDKEQAAAVSATPAAVGATPVSTGKEVANYPGLWGVFRMVNGGRYKFDWGGTLQPPSNNPFAVEFNKIKPPDSYK